MRAAPLRPTTEEPGPFRIKRTIQAEINKHKKHKWEGAGCAGPTD